MNEVFIISRDARCNFKSDAMSAQLSYTIMRLAAIENCVRNGVRASTSEWHDLTTRVEDIYNQVSTLHREVFKSEGGLPMEKI